MSLTDGISFFAATLKSDLSSHLVTFVVLAGIIGAVSYFLKRQPRRTAEVTETSGPLAYQLRPSLLTNAERSFYGVLLSVVAGKGTVFAKVRVSDIVTVPSGVSNRQAQVNRVLAKHVDFAICDPSTLRVLVGIEVDDASHKRLDRQERDSFLAEVFACAKLPLIRVPVKHGYTLDEVRALVEPYLPIEERTVSVPSTEPRGGSIIVTLPPNRS